LQHSNPGSIGKEDASTMDNYQSYYVHQMQLKHNSCHDELTNLDQSARTKYTSAKSSLILETPQKTRISCHIWDHAIELKPNTPAALPGKLIPLSKAEQEELHNFVAEHTKRGTIRPSKSPYKL
jgi:hypothetical protein